MLRSTTWNGISRKMDSRWRKPERKRETRWWKMRQTWAADYERRAHVPIVRAYISSFRNDTRHGYRIYEAIRSRKMRAMQRRFTMASNILASPPSSLSLFFSPPVHFFGGFLRLPFPPSRRGTSRKSLLDLRCTLTVRFQEQYRSNLHRCSFVTEKRAEEKEYEEQCVTRGGCVCLAGEQQHARDLRAPISAVSLSVHRLPSFRDVLLYDFFPLRWGLLRLRGSVEHLLRWMDML